MEGLQFSMALLKMTLGLVSRLNLSASAALLYFSTCLVLMISKVCQTKKKEGIAIDKLIKIAQTELPTSTGSKHFFFLLKIYFGTKVSMLQVIGGLTYFAYENHLFTLDD